ncbi:hypothetical protein BSPWISOX_2011 [uncultured Gammaproteobacteria bacterium]|nr:hypothetical protein BSPWISOX_2011 [uncultured Gammaproteobacteria bacterium]
MVGAVRDINVSVAGCLGYDVLGILFLIILVCLCFSCWLFRL